MERTAYTTEDTNIFQHGKFTKIDHLLEEYPIVTNDEEPKSTIQSHSFGSNQKVYQGPALRNDMRCKWLSGSVFQGFKEIPMLTKFFQIIKKVRSLPTVSTQPEQ